MDFRSCPACKASVLEDDVEDCPFCGASMSGKPTAAAPKKPAASSGPARPSSGSPAAGGAAKSPAASSRPQGGAPKPGSPGGRPAAPKSGDDAGDPFEVDTTALRKAIKLVPRPTKVRTLEVKCPMCETVGYLPPSEAGKDVQCCNPECIVPVFKSPRPQVEEAPVEAPKDNRMLILGGGTVAAIVAVALVWFLVLRPEPNQVTTEEFEIPNRPSIEELELVPKANTVVRETEARPETPEEIRKKSLEDIAARARQKDRNRNADVGSQLAAEAFAQAGDISMARDQLRRIQSASQYLQIQPLVEIGWTQLFEGKSAEAGQTVTTALARAKDPPKSIRKSLDAVTALAALCVATGRTQDAESLIQKELDRGERGEVSMWWRSAVDNRTFRIDLEAGRPWHLAVPEPMRVAVVESLMGQGLSDEALAFAATGENPASQGTCRAAWAGRLAASKPDQVVEAVTAALQKAKAAPAGETQAWAAVASMANQNKQSALASGSLEKAVASAAGIQARKAVAVPGLKEIHGSEGRPFAGLPNPAEPHAATLAYAHLAVAQHQAGQKEAAWGNFLKAVEQARGMAPSPAQTQQLLDECQSQEAALRAQLNQVLNLGGTETRLRAEFGRYRRQCGRLHAEAQNRFQLQVALLRRAAELGYLQEVWDLMTAHHTNPDLALKEPYLDSTLPSLLFSLAKAAGNKALADQIKGAFPTNPLQVEPLDELYADTAAALDRKDYKGASDLLRRAYNTQIGRRTPDWIDGITLRVCGRAQGETAPDAMVPFIKNLHDVVIQEEAFLLLAGNSMRSGTASQLWKATAGSRDLDALDHVSLYRGFVAGYSRQPSSVSSVSP